MRSSTNPPIHQSTNPPIHQSNHPRIHSSPNITPPRATTSIGFQAFFWCTSLLNITVAPDNPAYASRDGVLFDHSLTTLMVCPGGRVGSYVIPDSVTNLADQAFWACENLTSIVVDAGISNLIDDTFGIAGNGVLYFKGNPPTIDGSAAGTLYSPVQTVYYLPGTTGWGAYYGGSPAVLWNPAVQTGDGQLGRNHS